MNSSKLSFIAELRRRNVHRAAVFHAGAAWLLVQIAMQVLPFFDVPNSTVRIVVIAAAIGFPFAMLFSWFYEWTSQGIRRESEIDHRESITAHAGRILARLVAAGRNGYTDHSNIAAVRLAPDDRDGVLAEVDQADRDRPALPMSAGGLPWFTPLHGDPRFQALLDRISAGAIREAGQ